MAIPKNYFPVPTSFTLDSEISQLKLHGKGALMSKLDLSDAFRHILVRHKNWGSLNTHGKLILMAPSPLLTLSMPS